MLDAEPEVAELPNASSLPQTIRGEVEFDHVYFHYNGDTALKVLEDICTRAEARKVTAVLGATGSGKSSLFEFLKFLRDGMGEDIPPEIVKGAIGQQVFHKPGEDRFWWSKEKWVG